MVLPQEHLKVEIHLCYASVAIEMLSRAIICPWSVLALPLQIIDTLLISSASIRWMTCLLLRLCRWLNKLPSFIMLQILLCWDGLPRVPSTMRDRPVSILPIVPHHLRSEVPATSIKILQAAVPTTLLFRVALPTITVLLAQAVV